jgi:hypothetical protein
LAIARPKLAKRLDRDATSELHRFVARNLDGVFKATRKFIDFTMAYLPDPPAVRPYKWLFPCFRGSGRGRRLYLCPWPDSVRWESAREGE